MSKEKIMELVEHTANHLGIISKGSLETLANQVRLKTIRETVEILDNYFEVKEHLQCGNENCFYYGEWCYHFTDKDLEKIKASLNKLYD